MTDDQAQEVAQIMIRDERAGQDLKWGRLAERHVTNTEWISILAEEVGEAAQIVNDKGHPTELIKELVQVAAVATAHIQMILMRRS